ncbi:tetratricopeptide repeat protein [Caminibacter sp.]
MKNGKLLGFIVLIFLIGCSVKKPQIGKKVIPNEDDYIITALVYDSNNEYNKSIPIYRFLYEKTKKNIYLEQIVEDLFFEKKYDEVIKISEEYYKKHKKIEPQIFKYEIFALLEKGELQKAKELLKNRFNKKNEFFYSMMSFILIKEKKYNEAVYYLKSLYAMNPSKKNLLSLVDVLIKLKKYNEALAYLRTYLNLYGCNYDVCMRLVYIYKSLYDYDNLANIYEKLGSFDKKFYIMAFNIYLQNDEDKKAFKLIKKYHLSKEYLIYLYEKEEKYRKAAEISLEMYKKTGNDEFLLKYCEFLYEDHPTRKELIDMTKKLEYLANKYKNDYLYNFLGYVLIDNNINVKRGIKYVIKALQIKPDDYGYMDSLAWGYYKLGKCKDAWEIIKNINTRSYTINEHKKIIKRCLNDTRKNNKKNKRRFAKEKK